MELLPRDQIPKTLVEEASRDICDFSIGLVRLRDSGSEPEAMLGGSGTLVQIGDVYGILTACHVLDYIHRDEAVGLLIANTLAPTLQRVTVSSKAIEFFRTRVPCTHKGEQGPDVGLLLLSSLDAGSLKARKSFYNLGKREWMAASPPALEEGVWYLCGFPDESTTQRGPERRFTKVTSFVGACGTGTVGRELVDGHFDYLDFEVGYGGVNEPPRDFGGFSGGGLWQVPMIRTSDGTLKVKELLLSGVAFYQYPDSNDRRTIRCHGRRSIYGQTLRSVRSEGS